MTDEMQDRQAIIDLTAAYCYAIDSHEWDALDDVFTPDAHAELAESLDGVDAIKARIRRALEPLLVSQHLIGTHQVTVDGDRATSRCYLHAQHARVIDDEEAHFIVAGRYDDEMVRTPVGWRISRRELAVLWSEGNPAVLAP